MCNGVYYTNCTIDKNFICPNKGEAYCELIKTDNQKCEDLFGSDSLYTGQKNTNGGVICGCKNGYIWNNDNDSCITRDESCVEDYDNTSWDGTSCVCDSGYELNSTGTSCEKSNQEEKDRLTEEYNSNVTSIQQQIIDIKTQYYKDMEAIKREPMTTGMKNGMINKLTDEANTKINKLNLEIEQLGINYYRDLNNL